MGPLPASAARCPRDRPGPAPAPWPARCPKARPGCTGRQVRPSRSAAPRARRAPGGFDAARPAEKRDAVDAHEAGGRQRRRQRQHGADRRRGEMQRRLRQRRRGDDRLEQQPFRDEAVERRQGRGRERAHQEEGGGARHAMDEAAQPVEIAPSGGVQHGAGAQEQQRLEPGMVEHMQQGRGHATAAAACWPLARKASARPSATKITPTFSIVE